MANKAQGTGATLIGQGTQPSTAESRTDLRQLENGETVQNRADSNRNAVDSISTDIWRSAVNTWNKLPAPARALIATGVSLTGIAGITAGILAKKSDAESNVATHSNVTIPELTYPNQVWNTQPVEGATNCYDYARNDPSGKDTQPGQLAGQPFTELTCENIVAAALKDHLTHPITINMDGCGAVCPEDFHAVFLLLTTVSNGNDFHWLRQNINEIDGADWSQKHGFANPPTNVDGSGNVITCPPKANHDYYFDNDNQWLNYTQQCGYLCASNTPAENLLEKFRRSVTEEAKTQAHSVSTSSAEMLLEKLKRSLAETQAHLGISRI
jgi:hypothetical protein